VSPVRSPEAKRARRRWVCRRRRRLRGCRLRVRKEQARPAEALALAKAAGAAFARRSRRRRRGLGVLATGVRFSSTRNRESRHTTTNRSERRIASADGDLSRARGRTSILRRDLLHDRRGSRLRAVRARDRRRCDPRHLFGRLERKSRDLRRDPAGTAPPAQKADDLRQGVSSAVDAPLRTDQAPAIPLSAAAPSACSICPAASTASGRPSQDATP